MKVAAVQFRPPSDSPEDARRVLVGLVEDAAAAGARLVVCPEMAVVRYSWASAIEIAPFCEPGQGPTAAALAPIAERTGAWIACGIAERAPEGLFNSAVVVGPGHLFAVYRKVYLYPTDTTWAVPGRVRLVFDTPFGRLSPGICMDINDDGFVGHLGATRSRLCAFSTRWIDEAVPDVHAYWRERLGCWPGWLVAGGGWGEEADPAAGEARTIRFAGRSAVLGPGGEVLASAPREGDAVVVAEIPDQAPGTSM